MDRAADNQIIALLLFTLRRRPTMNFRTAEYITTDNVKVGLKHLLPGSTSLSYSFQCLLFVGCVVSCRAGGRVPPENDAIGS